MGNKTAGVHMGRGSNGAVLGRRLRWRDPTVQDRQRLGKVQIEANI